MKKREDMARAVGYCRTSGEGQRDNTSIPNQCATIESFCHTNDWKFGRHYIDESKTGSKIEGRDEFQQMLKDAALEKFDLIVVYDVTRFARDGVDILGQAKFLRQAFGIHVVDTKGRFDSRSSGNTLLNFVHAGLSEDERLRIMDRTIRGRIRRAEEGKPWSGNKPFGRDFDPATGKWSVNERGRRMRQLLERYAAGERIHDLLREFTEFSSSRLVLSFIRSAQLSGVYVKEFNIPELDIVGLRIPIPTIPEIITPKLAAKVQARLKHCRTWNQEHRRKYVLTGFVRCGQCGTAPTGNCTGGRIYYRHCIPARNQEHGCSFHSIREVDLEEPVLDYLYSFFTDEPTFNAAVARALPKEDEREALIRDRDGAAKSLLQVEKEIGLLAKAIIKGADPSLLISQQSELKAEQQRCTERLQEAQAKLDAMPERELLMHQAMTVRLALLKRVQQRDWRKLPFDEIKRFLIFLFGENPGKGEGGIQVTRERGRWRITFQGKVYFGHELMNGRTVSHLVRAEAARHNKFVGLTRGT